jgi:hypothetical protein
MRDNKLNEGIYKMFNVRELKGSKKNKWGRIFALPLPRIADALAPLAEQHSCRQQVKADHILWLDKSKRPVAMFCFITDPSELAQVKRVYNRIAKLSPRVTFAIVHQRSDGIGVYDIFRLSERSYLEHHNRVYNRK